MDEKLIGSIENIIGYVFKDKQLLITAMMHSSYANEQGLPRTACNERLEFLGDAVLETACSVWLFGTYPDAPEGYLSKKRASIVCEPTLAACAREIDLKAYLLLGKGERHTGGDNRDSILSDAFEALIGAIYLDGGTVHSDRFIHEHVLKGIEEKIKFRDSKTLLQELIQKYTHEPIVYEDTGRTGPDHDSTFYVRIRVGERILSSGSGRSKQAAGQDAAYKALPIAEKIFEKEINR